MGVLFSVKVKLLHQLCTYSSDEDAVETLHVQPTQSPTLPACPLCLHCESQSLDSQSGGGRHINRVMHVIKWSVMKESWKRDWKAPSMCQTFRLSRFPHNASCSFVWSRFYSDAWQFSSFRLADALSIDCDVQRRTESQSSKRRNHCHSLINTEPSDDTD